jgi:hypothetical protein
MEDKAKEEMVNRDSVNKHTNMKNPGGSINKKVKNIFCP